MPPEAEANAAMATVRAFDPRRSKAKAAGSVALVITWLGLSLALDQGWIVGAGRIEAIVNLVLGPAVGAYLRHNGGRRA